MKVYSLGQWKYRVSRRKVEVWDPVTKTWRHVMDVRYQRDGRDAAALDAYKRQVNP